MSQEFVVERRLHIVFDSPPLPGNFDGRFGRQSLKVTALKEIRSGWSVSVACTVPAEPRPLSHMSYTAEK